MDKKIPEIGEKFGEWTVRDVTVPNRFSMTQVVCECVCGKFAVQIAANLRTGKSKSCNSCAGRARAIAKPETVRNRLPKLKAENINEIRLALRQGMTAFD